MRTIATHVNADLDAALSAYLLWRYYFNRVAHVTFIGDDADAVGKDAVTDIGNIHDEASLRFDHHQGLDTSAAMLVFSFLRTCGIDVEAAAPLVMLVHDADLGRKTAEVVSSRTVGLHAIFAAKKNELRDDYLLFDWAKFTFDSLIEGEAYRIEGRANLSQSLVYVSDKIVGISGGSPSVSEAAAEAYPDAVLLVYEGGAVEADDGTVTYPWGVKRINRGNFHVGEMVSDYIADPEDHEVATALSLLWQHPMGWIALTGSGKRNAKMTDYFPIPVQLQRICEALELYVKGN